MAGTPGQLLASLCEPDGRVAIGCDVSDSMVWLGLRAGLALRWAILAKGPAFVSYKPKHGQLHPRDVWKAETIVYNGYSRTEQCFHIEFIRTWS